MNKCLNHKKNTLQIVSKPTLVSTNWFLRSPLRVTGTPTTCRIELIHKLEIYMKLSVM